MLRLLHELQVHEIELEMQNHELRESRASLETALTRYTELYDFAPVGYLTLGVDGQIAEINLTGATLLGEARRMLLNKRFTVFISPGYQDHWSRFFSSARSYDGHGSTELALRRGDGSVFYAQMDWLHHHLDTDGAALHLSASMRGVRFALTDISERKRTELALDATLAELNVAVSAAEQASRAKSDFLSSMSHELRTPLNAILGFAQLMESAATPPTVAQQRSLGQILKAGWHLLNLINEILDLAQVESGKLPLTLMPIKLADVIGECQAMIELQAQKHGIRVSFPQTEIPYAVNADFMRLKQVLINLLSNAIKYNRAGGTVNVECSVCRGDRGDRVRVAVKDSG